MSPATEDNLGRRRYLIERDKAVEEALEKVRRAPSSGWESLSADDRTLLRTLITEIWETCERGRWKQFCFSTLDKADIARLITLAEDVRTRHHLDEETRIAAETILLACSLDRRPQ